MLGDDVLRLVKNPDDLALAASVRLRLNSIERLIALANKIDPGSGNISGDLDVTGEVTAGFGAVTLDTDGISIAPGTGTVNRIKWEAGAESIYMYGDGSNFLVSAQGPGTPEIDLFARATTSAEIYTWLKILAQNVAPGNYLTGINALRRTEETNTVRDAIVLLHETAKAPVAGLGTRLSFYESASSGTGNVVLGGAVDSVLTDVTAGSLDASMKFYVLSAGTLDYTDDTVLVLTLSPVGVDAAGVYMVDGVQVVGNQVVDARCDDAVNSGDGTTDGVIDALRDAMIAHGLIAAA